MSNNVTLSLPLSATALRLGATLLTDLAANAEAIITESRGPMVVFSSSPEAASENEPHEIGLVPTEKADPGCGVVETTLEQDVQTAEAAAVDPYANETPEQRQYRLHGNVASSGQEPAPVITQETLPPVEYETIVTGYAPGPTPFADGHDKASYEAAGWDIAALLNAGHLVEVTEQRPLPVAPGASAAPSAPAPAPAPAAPAPTGSGVAVDKDGLPWDSRIHSDAAEKLTKTGVWKTRKNLAPGYKEKIEAELRSVMNAGKPTIGQQEAAILVATAPAPVTVTTATAAPTPAAPPAPSAAPAPAPAPSPAPAPAPAPSPAPAAAPAGNPFAEFTRWLVTHTKSGKLSQTDAVLEIQKQGLTQIPDLAKRPDLIPAVMAALTAAKGL